MPDPASLALLTQRDPTELRVLLAPGVWLTNSRWPVVSILGAHMEGVPSFAEVGALLQKSVAQDAVVWREGLRPRVRQAWSGELSLLQAMQCGQSLGDALDSAPAIDFAQWFPVAVQSGLIQGAARIDSIAGSDINIPMDAKAV